MFFTSFVLGKRTNETCRSLFKDFRKRIRKPTNLEKLEIYSDGNFSYQTILAEFFDEEKIDYGQLIKIKQGGKLVDKKKIIVYGNPKVDDIETTTVECINGILRERLSRLVRKTKSFAKDKKMIIAAVELFKFYWNFIKPLHGKATPAMEENITSRIMTWGSFLHMKLSDIN